MPRTSPTVRCPVCGSEVAFTLVVATVHAQTWTQTTPGRLKRDSRSPRRFDFETPLFFACGQCGQPLQMPAAITRKRR